MAADYNEDNPIRVVLVDDHPVVVQGLRALLEGEKDMLVVGEANDGSQVVDVIRQTSPDVVLMDIRMGQTGGLAATRSLKEEFPEVAVIMLTVYDADIYVTEAVRSGASGYLLKDSSPELLLGAIKTVVQGGVLFSGKLARAAIEGKVESEGIGTLSSRELEILNLLAKGLTNKEIASHLHLAEVTIKKQVQSLMRKMGVADRTRAAVMGVQLGLVGQ